MTYSIQNSSNKIQLSGVLYKKNINYNSGSNRWCKRYFVIRDGYLFYYPECDKKEFEKGTGATFNIHPKGVIPLGNCCIESHAQGHRFIITLKSEEYLHPFTLATDDATENEKWIDAIQQASRITWHHAQIGDTLIQELEKQGLYLWSEQEKVKEKLHWESQALQKEVDKNEELQKMAVELESEKRTMETMIEDLKRNYEKIKSELDETVSKMERLESSRPLLDKTINELQREIDKLTHEKAAINRKLREKNHTPFIDDNCDHQSVESVPALIKDLKASLTAVERKIDSLAREKAENEYLLHKNDNTSFLLQQDRQMFSHQAEELILCLNELHYQKDIATNEIGEEILERFKAKERIMLAEKSLCRIDTFLRTRKFSMIATTQHKDIFSNVARLKAFFEELDKQARQNSSFQTYLKSGSDTRRAIIQRAETIKILTLPRKRQQITSDTFSNPSNKVQNIEK